MFSPGSLFAVKELETVRGERRLINFYSAARLDGLVRREETFGMKLVEHFTGRDDRLEYRSATFGPAGGTSAGALSTAEGGVAASVGGLSLQAGAASISTSGSGAAERALPLVKITEKFARNPDKPADADVAKRVFHLVAGKTVLQYHHGEGRLTAGYLVFHRDGPAQAVQVSTT